MQGQARFGTLFCSKPGTELVVFRNSEPRRVCLPRAGSLDDAPRANARHISEADALIILRGPQYANCVSCWQCAVRLVGINSSWQLTDVGMLDAAELSLHCALLGEQSIMSIQKSVSYQLDEPKNESTWTRMTCPCSLSLPENGRSPHTHRERSSCCRVLANISALLLCSSVKKSSLEAV